MKRVRRALGLLLPVLAIALVLGGWLGLRARSAQAHLEAARNDLTTARAALLDRRVDDARAAIDDATRETARATAATGDPVWRVASAVPGLGRSLQAVRGITLAVDDVAHRVLPPGLKASEVFAGSDLRTPDGAINLSLVDSVLPQLQESANSLSAAQDRVLALPESGVLSPVTRARTQLVDQLDELAAALDKGQRAADLAPALLGADRPRRYFVMVQQPGESRGTGGLIGGYAVIEADKGKVTVTQSGSNTDLKNGTIPLPEGVSQDFDYEYGGSLALQDWQDVNLSPDLPTVAKVVAARWKAQSGQDVDGVIALDPTALADLLRGSGPIDVGAGKQVAPAGLVRFLTVDQYAGLPANITQTARKDALAQAAQGAAARLTAGGDLTQLLSGLADAVTSGHLRMASADPDLGPALAVAGVDGALPTAGDGPVAYAVVSNATQGKLDTFLDRKVTYAGEPCRTDYRKTTVTVDLTNRAPATGLPPYLTIKDVDADTPTGQSTDNAVVLQVYGSADAQLLSAELDGKPVGETALDDDSGTGLDEGLEGDLPFWRILILLPREATQTLTLHLSEPVVSGRPQVPEQPLVRPLQRSVTLPTC